MEPWKIRLAQILIRASAGIAPELGGEIALRIFTTPKRFKRPKWEEDLLATSSAVHLPGGLTGAAWGEVGRPVVLLIHGWQGRGTQLGMIIAPLVAKGFRVIAVDGQAHGLSPGRRTNISEFARALATVARDFGGVSIVAHSFGATASALAILNGAQIRAAVLVASPSDLIRVANFYSQRMKLPSRVDQTFRRRLAQWTGLSAEESDLAERGKNVKVPVLIAHDPEDKEVSFESAKRYQQFWPRVEVLPLDKLGHRKILKANAFLEPAAEFIARHVEVPGHSV